MAQGTVEPPLSSPTTQGVLSRLPSLTGARFIAAGLVFLTHTTLVLPFASPSLQKTLGGLFGLGGTTGVTFFFVLSGFVLTWSARPGDTPPAFWRRRFFKIYPNHLLTFVAAAIVLTVVAKVAVRGWDAVLNLLLLQSWHTDFAVRSGFNRVSWSLSCEALFYLCFPFLLNLINKVRPERLWFWTILSAASVISIPSFSMLLPDGPMLLSGITSWQLWFGYHFPPVAMLQFIFGIFLARLVLTGRRLPLRLGGAVALAVGAYFLSPLFPPVYHLNAVMVVPLGLLIAAAATADIDGQSTFLGSKPMVWLGEISFAFYLWHGLVLVFGQPWFGDVKTWRTPTTIVAAILLFAVSVLVSWATFKFFEQPIMRRFATSHRRRDLAAARPGSAGPTLRVRTVRHHHDRP